MVSDGGDCITFFCQEDGGTYSEPKAYICNTKIDWNTRQFVPGDVVFLNGGAYNDPGGHPVGYECTVISDNGEKVSVSCKDDGGTYNEPKSFICNAICACRGMRHHPEMEAKADMQLWPGVQFESLAALDPGGPGSFMPSE